MTTDREVVLAAARSWREARDAGKPAQPSLARALAAHDRIILAPVFDSLLLFYEAALGRPIQAGQAALPSDDELLLLSLIDGSRPRACLDCPKAAAKAFDCALCSTRIMMALAGAPAPRIQ